MERRREDQRMTDERRAGDLPARVGHEREVSPLGRSLNIVVYGIGQAVGGWWAERDVAASVRQVTFGDDVVYRAHYDFSPARLADRSYEVVRPAYLVGHLAATNPSYDGVPFESIEHELRTGWSEEVRKKHGDWESVRQYAKEAFGRQRQRVARASGEHRRVSMESSAQGDSGGETAD